jgi:hypothetical protein
MASNRNHEIKRKTNALVGNSHLTEDRLLALQISRVRIFSCVQPFYEPGVSDLDPKRIYA